jgi:tripartite-type tricarboxylate transporter receptor subunit TctC
MFRSVCLLIACIAAGSAGAQSWPAKPVKVIVPNAPGTTPDVVTRLAADRLAKALGTSFVIENNTAGAGLVAAQTAARAAPDGYTLFVGTITSFAINPHMFKSLPYRPDHDFVGVALIYDGSAQVVAVHPDVPAKNLGELFALAKSQPGKLAYAADRGLASIVGEWMKKRAGADITLIPYKVPSHSLSDTASGRTQMIVISIPLIDSMMKAGKLRVLAVTSPKRFPGLPDVPTIGETLPGVYASGWSALVAPAGTPGEVLQRVNRATEQAVRDPEYKQRLLGFGLTADSAGTLDSIAELFRSERERWGKIIREVGVKPE